MMLTNGFSVVASAGLGFIKGIYDSSKSNHTISKVPSGTGIKLKVLEDFTVFEQLQAPQKQLVIANANDVGIDLEIKECKQVYSYNFGDSLAFNLQIKNYSGVDFDISDLILVDKKNSEEFLFNPLLSSFDLNHFELKGNSQKNFNLTYSLGNIKAKNNYELRIIDPLDFSHKLYFPVKID